MKARPSARWPFLCSRPSGVYGLGTVLACVAFLGRVWGGGLVLPALYLASSLTLPWSLLSTSTSSMKGAFSLQRQSPTVCASSPGDPRLMASCSLLLHKHLHFLCRRCTLALVELLSMRGAQRST